jgi:hypothetical protein
MRARIATVLMVAAGVLVLSQAGFAQTTTVTFDDVTAPCVFTQTVPLTTEYASQGVTFAGPVAGSGGAVLNSCANFGVTGFSAPNYLAFNAGVDYLSGGTAAGPATITFASPPSRVAIDVGASGAGSGTATLVAYSGAAQVGQQTITLSPTMAPLSVSALVITSVVLSFTTGVLVMDDLSWGTFAVPLSMDDCKNGGWQTVARADGSGFKNQGDCIQYVNTGK